MPTRSASTNSRNTGCVANGFATRGKPGSAGNAVSGGMAGASAPGGTKKARKNPNRPHRPATRPPQPEVGGKVWGVQQTHLMRIYIDSHVRDVESAQVNSRIFPTRQMRLDRQSLSL